MAQGISPTNEEFILRQIELGIFRNRDEALDTGIALLRRPQEFLDRIAAGRRQLDDGDYTEYDEEGLQERFAVLKRRAEECHGESK